MMRGATNEQVAVPADAVTLEGNLCVPTGARGIVLFAHGSGSSRHSPRNRFVAERLQEAGLATLLFDLLTPEEEARDLHTRRWRFDIDLLARRLLGATDWVAGRGEFALGYFGASTGAAAALVAATERPALVRAVVSRGGRPDLAGASLPRVRSATLLVVGGEDQPVIALNQQALAQLGGPGELAIVPGATHLFEEPGTLEEVARLAGHWFGRWLTPS